MSESLAVPSPHKVPRKLPTYNNLSRLSSINPNIPSAKAAFAQELFLERHSKIFAHLHEHPDAKVKREKEELEAKALEEDRREGRKKRESWSERPLVSVAQRQVSGGKRPLSLLGTSQRASRRPISVRDSPSPCPTFPIPAPEPSSIARAPSLSLTRCATLSPPAISASLSSPPPILSRRLSDDSQLNKRLTVVMDSRFSSPVDSKRSSIAPSVISWATDFSGDIDELGVAARYLPTSSSVENHLSSPEKRIHRKERIVAMAKTTRLLEGKGTRVLDDPETWTFVPEEAWASTLNGGFPVEPSEEVVTVEEVQHTPSAIDLASGYPDYLLTPPLLVNREAPETGSTFGSMGTACRAWMGPQGADLELQPSHSEPASASTSHTAKLAIRTTPIAMRRSPAIENFSASRVPFKPKRLSFPSPPAPIPVPLESGTSLWGLGRLGSWWKNNAAGSTCDAEDFPQGENGQRMSLKRKRVRKRDSSSSVGDPDSASENESGSDQTHQQAALGSEWRSRPLSGFQRLSNHFPQTTSQIHLKPSCARPHSTAVDPSSRCSERSSFLSMTMSTSTSKSRGQDHQAVLPRPKKKTKSTSRNQASDLDPCFCPISPHGGPGMGAKKLGSPFELVSAQVPEPLPVPIKSTDDLSTPPLLVQATHPSAAQSYAQSYAGRSHGNSIGDSDIPVIIPVPDIVPFTPPDQLLLSPPRLASNPDSTEDLAETQEATPDSMDAYDPLNFHPRPRLTLPLATDAIHQQAAAVISAVRRDSDPSSMNSGLRKKARFLFFLGFLMPFLWIIGGWSSPDAPRTALIDSGVELDKSELPIRTGWNRYIDHENHFVRRCRIASVVGTVLLFPAILGVILLLIFLL